MANIMRLGGSSTVRGEDSIPVQGRDFEWTGEDGTLKVVYDFDGNWRIRFLDSGTFTPLADMTVDAFLVGGGGAGGTTGNTEKHACGGGGGYTATQLGLELTANTAYEIVVGAGGEATAYYVAFGGDGGATSAFGITVEGGTGGGNRASYYGGNGGSGGGTKEGLGGTDGADGVGVTSVEDEETGEVTWYGKGQGTTTREFGEEDGELYANGGDGGVDLNTSLPGFANTGNGGTGTIAYFDAGRVGGSGIVIIRNPRG